MSLNHYALLFPGQGSQSLGMLGDLAPNYPIIQETFAEASSVLDYDLWALTQEGPESQLNQTAHTQPALLAADIALYRVWSAKSDIKPVVMAGHSLGEYAALVAAGSFRFKDAVLLVAARGRAMQDAVPEGLGAMAAIIGLDSENVTALCDKASEGEILSPANFNSMGQIVIAGHAQAVDRALALAPSYGAKIAKRIPVSVPSHCALMAPAAAEMARMLSEVAIAPPNISVIHNVDVKTHQSANDIREALVTQLTQSVRWLETIQAMQAQGVTTFLECGPGKVLSGLNKRIDRSFENYVLSNELSLEQLTA